MEITNDDDSSDFYAPQVESSSTRQTDESIFGTNGVSSDEQRFRRRKRKKLESSSTRSQSRRKRLKTNYSGKYRTLFNETLSHILNDSTETFGENSKPTQLGLSSWNDAENHELYNRLFRKGRNELPSITDALGSKCEPEFHAQLLRVSNASTQQQVDSPYESLMDHSTIPAALEIGPQCETALEYAADALNMLQQQNEELADRARYGLQWRLTAQIGRSINNRLKEIPQNQVKEVDLIPETFLLNLYSFLHLTRRVFMNSSDADYHWRTHAVNGNARPSITRTAFADLHNLVLIVTKRLVRSAAFLATSRSRCLEGERKRQHYRVNRQDVLAAINIVGMKKDRHSYWVGLARRCKLKVYGKGRVRETTRGPSRDTFRGRMGYDTVEQILNQGRNDFGRYARTPLEPSSRATSLSMDDASFVSSESTVSMSADLISNYGSKLEPEYESEFTAQAKSASESDIVSESCSNSSGHEQLLDYRSGEALDAQDRYDNTHDAYISAIDQCSSVREEQRLWDILAKSSPVSVDTDEDMVPEMPSLEPKPLEDIQDWRKEVSYVPEWETLEDFAHGRSAPFPDPSRHSKKKSKSGLDGSAGDTSSMNSPSSSTTSLSSDEEAEADIQASDDERETSKSNDYNIELPTTGLHAQQSDTEKKTSGSLDLSEGSPEYDD